MDCCWGQYIMTVMYVCGLSMEMEMAEELGVVGKCTGCLYLDFRGRDRDFRYCSKNKELLEEEIVDCPDWVVDHR